MLTGTDMYLTTVWECMFVRFALLF